ncbi:hypothetical protein Tco_1211717 [Tanacetum coccineum]
MSTPAYVNSETITQADRAQSSQVPVPLLDDPYVAVRKAQLVGTDTGSDPKDAPSEAEESQPLGSRVPLMSEEFKASKPSGTRIVSSHSLVSSDSTAPLTARMVMRTQPTLSPGMSARLAEATALSPSSFRKRYRSSYETSSSSSSTLLVQKRYKGTFELILDTDSEGDELGEEDTKKDESSDAEDEREGQRLDDEGHGLDDEAHGLDDEAQGLDDEGQGSKDECPAVSKPLGLGYGAARRRALESTKEIAPNPEDGKVYTDILTYVPLAAPVQTPPSLEWLLGSLSVSPSSPLVPSPIALLVATPAATISVDEDQFLEKYRFRSLRREQERTTMTFSAIWRPLLALEAWAGQTDAQRAALWHAIYDI